MRKDKQALKDWAIAYSINPNENPSSTKVQALAIKIHLLLADGEFRTAKAIADHFQEPLETVRMILQCVRVAWQYEASKSKTQGGYRRIK
jgi:hypothetical protein